MSLYPGFEKLTAEVLNVISEENWPIGDQRRQFFPEWMLLYHFALHPCRVQHHSNSHNLTRATPHFYIVPMPWRALSSISDERQREHMFGSAEKIMGPIARGALFQNDPEHHVVLHTSTSALSSVFRRLSNAFVDPRTIFLHLEGVEGDPRAGPGKNKYYIAGSRTVTVPYFVESPACMREAHAQLNPIELAQARAETGTGARVYMRASAKKGGAFRKLLAHVFANDAAADVQLGAKATRQGIIEKLPARAQLATFLATQDAFANSTFCLVPPGITATSKRLYEAMVVGCVPVLVSDKYVLPGSRILPWDRAIVRHRQADAQTLPTRLIAISDADVMEYRRVGATLLRRLRYADAGGSAASLVWNEIARLGNGAPIGALDVLPGKLKAAVATSGQLVMTACSASATYAAGQQKSGSTAAQTGRASVQGCIRWHRSLRSSGYRGPVAIATGDAVPPQELLALMADRRGGGTWLLRDLEARLPRHVPVASLERTLPGLAGNQLRLVWYASILSELEVYAPRANVLALDARDVVLQADPIAALTAAATRLSERWQLAFVGDCLTPALTDRYFKAWGPKCLPPSALAALGQSPPVNGGVVLGKARALRRLYAKAAILASAQPTACKEGAREQHVLTGAAYELRALHPRSVVVVPNNIGMQTAVFNMGVNNEYVYQRHLKLNERSGFVEGPAGQKIAILHQFERRNRAPVFEFLQRHATRTKAWS